ncbi:hypothetical protein PP175_12290 [Aneurinibacillus sp. Ricciae_BoGa-3]|uniref:hypothetical protein n=1 Tax=Aneurinibacillus sp. Ricciae_BoGa-3 TaxID=3022697 RepID=UPI002341CD60|nr:hypothetical protein [Aneurinibacillus sp. Ricciae_BoGa-3]WCK56617.1 hypothetical protein PP175_12290 [Aneurinibacillus sp. Ricciae_BoGa-3]
MNTSDGAAKKKIMDKCAKWIENRYECEVYFIHDEHATNGMAEYRNDGHIIYILGDQEKMDLDLFVDILSHEAGHVLYNKRAMDKGISYEEIVQRTANKLSCFDQLLQQKLISDEEYNRLYAAIEEEWESNRTKEKIAAELQQFL